MLDRYSGCALGSYDMLSDRFWAKVNKTEACWLWNAAQSADGYGQFKANRRQVKAHRFAYELLVGPIPDGLQLDHLCRIRHCVNPAHLEPVTPKENIRRGRRANSEKSHCPQGHSYDAGNTKLRQHGGRNCRACDRARHQRSYWQRATRMTPEAA